MKSRFIQAILIAILFAALQWVGGFSQTSISTLERLEVAFWPEYDQPAVLVIYRFRLPDSTPLPSTVRVQIPAGVGEPHAVAYREETTGELLNADFNLEVERDWATVTIQMDGLQGQLEYYAELQFIGDERTYTFEWPGGVQINQFGYEIQQPFAVQDVQIDPPMGSPTVGSDGLTYFRADAGNLAPGSSFSITFSYTKSDSQLTLNALQDLPPLSPVEAPRDRALDIQGLLPYLLGVVGVGLVGIGLFLYFRPTSDRGRDPQPRRRSRKPKRSGIEVDASPLFCQNCGTQAGSGDHYCRQCGTKLRR